MKSFLIRPEIKIIDTIQELISCYCISDSDVIFTTHITLEHYLKDAVDQAIIVDYDRFGHGEPNDVTVEKICHFLEDKQYHRVFAIGGGTVLDIAKLFALKQVSPVTDLFTGKIKPVKDKKLILIPTTCGTGSEVTNISILELTSMNTKFGLAQDELYGDEAILCSEFLNGLPLSVFATSSIDALIHAVESFTSPQANNYTKMFSLTAMKLILTGYQKIIADPQSRIQYNKQFLIASNYAGIAFSNAGCGPVHAMSYPLGAKYHIPHGESNYAIFTGVYKTYQKMAPGGTLKELNTYLADILQCDQNEVYEKIEELLNHILKKKSLKQYGVTSEDIDLFTQAVIEKQGRLMKNSYVPLTAQDIKKIYEELYE